MSLLDFARGPALQWSLIIMVIGVVWRLAGIFLFKGQKYLSKPKGTKFVSAGLKAIANKSFPPHELEKRITFQHYTGYLFHIMLFVVVFLFEPHIEFFEWLLGISWPGLPTYMITFAAAVTVIILLALGIRRATDPVMRKLTTLDDWISYFLTITPFITGMMAFAHQNGVRYEDLLALHFLNVCLLMIWIPFGKLMHMFLLFPGRYQVGTKFEYRGVKA